MDFHDHHNADVRRSTKRGWQYSLLGLLVVTTIVSICLALGVNFPRTVLAVLAAGLLQVAALYSADWLMRSRGGRTVRQVSSCLWAILGTALLVVAWGTAPLGRASSLSLALTVAFAAGGAMSWIIAWRRWP